MVNYANIGKAGYDQYGNWSGRVVVKTGSPWNTQYTDYAQNSYTAVNNPGPIFTVDLAPVTDTVTVQGTPSPPPAVALPTSQSGIMVPYIIGSQRVFSPNVIWYGNLQPRTETTKKLVSTEQYELSDQTSLITRNQVHTVQTVEETTSIVGYNIDMQVGVCLGPGTKLVGIWENNAKIWEGSVGPDRETITLDQATDFFPSGSLVFGGGEFDQAPDSSIEDYITTGLSGYPGIAYVVSLGANATGSWPAIAFDVERYPDPLLLGTKNRIDDDINLATAMYDYLTNPWGGVGISTDLIDSVSFKAAGETLYDEGNFCSMFIQQEGSVSDVVKNLQVQARGYVYEDFATGKLGFNLVRDEDFDIDTVPLFNEKNITGTPRGLGKSSWENIPNQLRGTFTDREGNYSKGVAIAQNLAILSTAGRNRITATQPYPTCMTKGLAAKLVARDLALGSIPANSVELSVNRDGANLNPGDGLKLSWADWQIEEMGFVVTRKRDQPKSSNQIILSCSAVQTQKTNVLFAQPDDSLFDPIDVSPHEPSSVVAKTAPFWLYVKVFPSQFGMFSFELDKAAPILLAERYSSIQTSFDTYIENVPDIDEALVRQGSAYASIGELNAAIGQYDDVADGIIASIQIDSVNNATYLRDIGLDGVRKGQLLMFIGDEILSFESVTSLGAGSYQLNNVHRGLLDTAPTAHAANDPVYIIPTPYSMILGSVHDWTSGETYTPHMVLVGRTIDQVQDVENGLAYSLWSPDDRANLPLRPHNTKIEGSARSGTAKALTIGADFTVSWAVRSRATIATVTLQADASESLEQYSDGTYQRNRVMVKDSNGDEHDCGLTASGEDDSITANIPSGAATGAGVLWVQAESPQGSSKFHDYLPVTLS